MTQRANVRRDNGAMLADHGAPAVHYTTGQEDAYFGWTDAE
ncbi:hypothetical protein [Candidatus Laterigemmans baculatus]|nr:hypothetical protein [Candidatus Laterigemmans baculatus]